MLPLDHGCKKEQSSGERLNERISFQNPNWKATFSHTKHGSIYITYGIYTLKPQAISVMYYTQEIYCGQVYLEEWYVGNKMTIKFHSHITNQVSSMHIHVLHQEEVEMGWDWRVNRLACTHHATTSPRGIYVYHWCVPRYIVSPLMLCPVVECWTAKLLDWRFNLDMMPRCW